MATPVNAVVTVRYRPTHFGWLPGLKEIRQALGFGSKLSLSTIVSNMASGAAELFLVKLQGLAAAFMAAMPGAAP